MSETLAPLWSDERIKMRTMLEFNDSWAQTQVSMRVSTYMRDTYEAERQRLSAERAALTKRVQELEAQLAEVRTRLSQTEAAWEPIEQLMFGEDDDHE